ncbi:hypothetical protein Tco_0796924 [Tanacetum coccineum]
MHSKSQCFHHDVIHLHFQRKGVPQLLTDQVDDGNPQVQRQQATSTGVPDQFGIEEECKYDFVAMYGILSFKWFSRKRFRYERFHLKGDAEQCQPYGHKLGYADIAVEDFQLGIESYQTQLNLTKPRWEATGFEFKHDYTVIDSPRAVTFRDRYGVQMIMRFNEIHKFSDGTLQQIDEALDYRVKEFQINRTNPGMNTRFWTKKDVDRSKDFMFAIQKRLKTRRIFRNLESFVGGRIREGDYRTRNEDGNPSRANIKQALGKYGDFDDYTSDDLILILEILSKRFFLKMNLPDHRSVLTDPEDQAKMEMETPRSSGVNSPPNAHT